MGKQEGKKLTKNGLPKPLRRRGCERIRWDMGGSLSLELRPPQAPPGGGDVPGGIRNAVSWGDGRRKNWT